MEQPRATVVSGPSKLQLVVLVAFFNGLSLSLLYAAIHTMFLMAWGSNWLPYVFVCVSMAVAPLLYVYSDFQRRFSLSTVTQITFLLLISLCVISWTGLTLVWAPWMSFSLMLALSLMMTTTGIVIGTVSNRMFDLREMKVNYPMVLASQVVAAIAGGLAAGPLTSLFHDAQDLLLVAAMAYGGSFVGIRILSTRYPEKMSRDPSLTSTGRHGMTGKSIGQLLRKRYVALLFGYQMLSNLGTQLVVYLFLIQADSAFQSDEAFAHFFGNFTAVGTFATLLFLLLVSRQLFQRYGLYFGLAANPVGVTLSVVLIALAGLVSGTTTTVLFWLTVGARAADFVLTMGTSATAVKTCYQALPEDERITVQTAVEGIGVPLSTGIAGVSLIVFEIAGATTAHVILYTLGVGVLWTAIGTWLYRDYADALFRALSRRRLGNSELTLDDESSMQVIEGLFQSGQLSEVRLALDMLNHAQAPSLDVRLVTLLEHPSPEVQEESLCRVEYRKPAIALQGVYASLESPNGAVRGAALRALCALEASDCIETVVPFLDNGSFDTRLGAMVGLLRHSGIPGVMQVGHKISQMEQSDAPEQRLLVARVLGAVGIRNFYQPLIPLLEDPDPTVRKSAIVAAGKIGHPKLVDQVVGALAEAEMRSAAVSALVTIGEAIVPVAASALDDVLRVGEDVVLRLVHVLGQIRSPEATRVLEAHMNHPDDDVQYHVLRELRGVGYRAHGGHIATVCHTLKGEVQYGLRLLLAQEEFAEEVAYEVLQRALDYEIKQVQRRVLLLLSFIYDHQLIRRASKHLEGNNSTEQAVAMETLEVTITPEEKLLIFPLIDPKLTRKARIRILQRQFPIPTRDPNERLHEIITPPKDPHLWTHGWTRACAIAAVAATEATGAIDAVRAAISIDEPPISETAIWALHTLAPEQFAAEVDALDIAPEFAPLVATLTSGCRGDLVLTIDKVALLRRVPLFERVPEFVLASVSQILVDDHFSAGTPLYASRVRALHIVLTGRVSVRGGYVERSGCVGEMALVDDRVPLEATAVGSVRTLRLDSAAFRNAMKAQPLIAHGIIEFLAHRLRMRPSGPSKESVATPPQR